MFGLYARVSSSATAGPCRTAGDDGGLGTTAEELGGVGGLGSATDGLGGVDGLGFAAGGLGGCNSEGLTGGNCGGYHGASLPRGSGLCTGSTMESSSISMGVDHDGGTTGAPDCPSEGGGPGGRSGGPAPTDMPGDDDMLVSGSAA